MLVVTTGQIPGYRTEAVLGEVVGAGHFFLRMIDQTLTDAIYRCREDATKAMWQQATARGGNAVVGFHVDVQLSDRALIGLAVGTAVSVTPLAEGEDGATPQSIEDAKQPKPTQPPPVQQPQYMPSPGYPMPNQQGWAPPGGYPPPGAYGYPR